MDRKYIDDHHIVARYLADQLPEEERAAFEAACLRHPDLVQEMEAAARLKLGLRRLHAKGEFAVDLPRQHWYSRRSAYVAAAAVVLLSVGTVRTAMRLPELQPVLAVNPSALQTLLGSPRTVVDTYPLLRTRRGTRYDLEIAQPLRGQMVEWRVLPEYVASPARYRMTLALLSDTAATQKIAELNNLEPAADGYVPVFVNGARLGRGRYELVLSSGTANGAGAARSRFLIRVR